jgi:hypothetical protein
MVDNAEAALSKASKVMDVEVINFTAGPIFMGNDTKGGHEWLIEFNEAPKDLARFTHLLDQFLKEENSDYEAKRYKNITLELPKIHSVKKGLFYEWLSSKDKLGGQHKVPRLLNNRNLLEELLKINY